MSKQTRRNVRPSKTKRELEKELKEALKALEGYEAGGDSALDTSWLPEKAQKQVDYFLDRVCQKRQCEPDRVIAACLAWCAMQSTARHGLHRLVQTIELGVKCKI